MSKAAARGQIMQPVVAQEYGKRHPELTIEPADAYFRDPDLRLGATPDYFIKGDPRGLGVLECKTVAYPVFENHWDNGHEPDQGPIIQTLVQQIVTGAKFGVVAVVVVDPFGLDFYEFEVPDHQAAKAKLIAAVKQFWTDVDAGRDPTPDFERDADVIRALAGRELAGKEFDASGNNELPVLLAQRAALMARIKSDEAHKEAIENEVRFMMKDAERMTGIDGWSILFKTYEYKEYTVAARTTRVLRITDKRPAHERPTSGEEIAA